MLSGLKFYFALVLALITAQIVIAGERAVDFQRALKAYEKEREPSQTKNELEKKEMVNPEIEVSLKEKEEKKEPKVAYSSISKTNFST